MEHKVDRKAPQPGPGLLLGFRAGWLALGAGLALLAGGCAVLDSVPWPGSPGSGRPAQVRRSRLPEREPPAVAPAQGAGLSALRGVDAALLARRLDPASQSLRSYADLAEPLRTNLAHLSRMPQEAPALAQPGGSLTWGQLRTSAEELLALLPSLDADPGLLAERFVWYELAPRPQLTGYYSPEFAASPVRAPGFEFPLYAPPPDLAARKGAYERRAVDLDGALAGRGLELAWLENPADVFSLQTEGGGVLRYADGTRRGVHFAATNGLEFKGLGQIMLESGALRAEAPSRGNIRAWCARNPAQALELMAQNRSYVFFRFTAAASEGSLGKALTALVSLATDPSLLPLGSVAVLDAPLPAGAFGPATALRGLVLAQDTGAGIRGTKLDLYLGSGERAESLEAGLRTPATLHLLVSKNALRSKAAQRGP